MYKISSKFTDKIFFLCSSENHTSILKARDNGIFFDDLRDISS